MHWILTRLAVVRHFSFRLLLSSILQALGALWVVVEGSSHFFPTFGDGIRDYWWAFLALGGSWGTVRAWPRPWVKSRISSTDVWVEIRVCDLFALKGALVVGSNTTFDTSIEDDTISRASIQGEFTERLADTVAELDRKIERSLQGTPFRDRTEDKTYGKRKEYPVGTVASVKCSGRRGYLVAIASLNAERVAATKLEDVLGALPFLWEFIRNSGSLEPLCCPVLGSGLSRLNATREELIREIVKSFVASTRIGKFCEHLTIAISPADFRSSQIDLEALRRFLVHECTYTSPGAVQDESVLGEAVTEERARAVFREELGAELQQAVETSIVWACSNSECPDSGRTQSGLGPSPRCTRCGRALGKVLA